MNELEFIGFILIVVAVVFLYIIIAYWGERKIDYSDRWELKEWWKVWKIW